MVADTKKCQTMINVMADQAQAARSALSTMKTVRDLFNAHNPDVTGTPLEGNLSYINTAINDLDTALNSGANKTVWDEMIAAYVPSHRSKALEE